MILAYFGAGFCGCQLPLPLAHTYIYIMGFGHWIFVDCLHNWRQYHEPVMQRKMGI